jgi:hypothetical protein
LDCWVMSWMDGIAFVMLLRPTGVF